MLVAIVVASIGCSAGGPTGVETSAQSSNTDREPEPRDAVVPPLQKARAGFATEHVANSFEPAGAPDTPPPEWFELVEYQSDVGKLAAYITPDPGDGKKHPAIVWGHGGFGGIGDWLWTESEPMRVFREAGFVIFCPSWRGENANPGRFELFYGEIDDAVAAVEHVRRLPYVDTKRVYFAGHSTGGTIALLAALSTHEIRAAFSFGGAPDIGGMIADGSGYGNTPFPPGDEKERRLRSAIEFVEELQVPTYYFEGRVSAGYVADAERMEQRARAADAPFRAFPVAGGDHSNIMEPLTRMVADKLRQDTGEGAFDITITKRDVLLAFDGYVQSLLSGERGASAREWRTVLAGLAQDLQLSRALQVGQAAIELYPRNSVLYYYYGWALFRLKDYSRAAAVLDAGLQLAPEDVDFLMLAASTAWIQGHAKKTRELFTRAVREAPYEQRIVNARDAFEREQRILAGQRPPRRKSAARAVYDSLKQLGQLSPEQSVAQHVAPDVLDAWVESIAIAIEGTDANAARYRDDILAWAIAIMRREYRNQTLQGFEVDTSKARPGSGDIVRLEVVLLLHQDIDEGTVQAIEQAVRDPSNQDEALSDLRALVAGLDERDARAYFRRLVEGPSTPHEETVEFMLRRNSRGVWKIIDFRLDDAWVVKDRLFVEYARAMEMTQSSDTNDPGAR